MPDWPDEFFNVCVDMPGEQWFGFVRAVGKVRNDRWRQAREIEADRLSQTMDMTPEGYVREWVRRGRKTSVPLDAWDHAYNRAGIIELAERLGYLRIGRDVACTITLEPRGEALVPEQEATDAPG